MTTQFVPVDFLVECVFEDLHMWVNSAKLRDVIGDNPRIVSFPGLSQETPEDPRVPKAARWMTSPPTGQVLHIPSKANRRVPIWPECLQGSIEKLCRGVQEHEERSACLPNHIRIISEELSKSNVNILVVSQGFPNA